MDFSQPSFQISPMIQGRIELLNENVPDLSLWSTIFQNFLHFLIYLVILQPVCSRGRTVLKAEQYATSIYHAMYCFCVHHKAELVTILHTINVPPINGIKFKPQYNLEEAEF